MAAGKITLRPVQDSDDEFLLKVYGSTREQELAQVPWTAEQKQQFVRMQWEAQKNHYAAQHPHATHEIICLESGAAGRLYLDRSGEKFHILDITLLPEHRNRGGGSLFAGPDHGGSKGSRQTRQHLRGNIQSFIAALSAARLYSPSSNRGFTCYCNMEAERQINISML